MNKKLNTAEILGEFISYPGDYDLFQYGNGHINDTYKVVNRKSPESDQYILQRVNTNVFTRPDLVMENITGVTHWLRKKALERGEDPLRATLNFIPARDGRMYYIDKTENCWRVCYFINGSKSYEKADTKLFYESAYAFGRFQRLLADYPMDALHETIPDFHNTPKRLETFKAIIEADPVGRAGTVQPEIQFILRHSDFMHILAEMEDDGTMPLRVTHNDTKLNNILMDPDTGKSICIADLDTVMPGLAVNDFGDAIRYGANTGKEDEKELSKVSCDLGLYRAYTEGFIAGYGGALVEAEIQNLHTGAMMMTIEVGMRFLTDYIDGDHYFKTVYPEHNLDRCRSQLKLFADMKAKQWQLKKIAEEAAAKCRLLEK